MKPARRLRRFFSSSSIKHTGEIVYLSEPESHHLHKTLRLKPGDSCLIMDPDGAEAEGKIEKITDDGIVAVRIETLKSDSRGASLQIHVYIAVPQRSKMEMMVEKSQEWGIASLIPLETERTIVKMNEAAKSRVLTRWEKISREAAKQSGSIPMKIGFPQGIDQALRDLPAGVSSAVFHPDSSALPFTDWAEALKLSRHNEINLFFGPEGGFSAREIEMLRTRPETSLISLGKSILKVDTAFLGVISALKLLRC